DLRSRPAITPRSLVIAARRALRGEEPLPRAPERLVLTPVPDDDLADPGERIAELWASQLTRARDEHDQLAKEGRGFEVERLLGALVAVASLAEGIQVEIVGARQKHDLRVVEGARAALVFVAQAVHPKTLAATMQSAARVASEAEVLVVRQHSLAIAPTWTKVR